MTSKVAQDALRRIANEIPDLEPDQLNFIGECLDDCFAVGKAWDDIPILIDEAEAPRTLKKPKSAAFKP